MKNSLQSIRSILFAVMLVAIFMAPLVWMLLTAVKSPAQINNRPKDILPSQIVVERNGLTEEISIQARITGPAYRVFDEINSVEALIAKADWERMEERQPDHKLSIREDLTEKGTTYLLVKPADGQGETFVILESELGHRPHVVLENFPEAMEQIGDFKRYLWNTLFVCGMQIIGQLFAASCAAYGFAVLEWRGREKLFTLLLATMMIPFPVLMIPLYDLFRSLGWLGSLKPLWVPALFASAFNVFLLRQFFLSLPKSLFEAARLDGCSELRILWSIVLPLSKPVLTTIVLFQFLFAWNDFLGPLIFLTEKEDYTISLALQFFQSQHGGIDWNLLMAASLITAAPIIAVFFVAQRFLIGGIAMSGMK